MFLAPRRFGFTPVRLLAFLSALSLGLVAYAQGDYIRELPAVGVTTAPKIDGELSPAEWPDAARYDKFIDGDTLVVSDERGEFWLTYTKDAIYFAGRVTTDPRRIIADEYRDNVSLEGNDNMRLNIDPFGQGTNFNSFATNASGATSINLAGGRAAKTEWLGEITAQGRKTETGWQFEMRIPWGIMALPQGGVKDPKFGVNWFRTNRQNTYSLRPFQSRPEELPVWRGLNVPAVATPRTISLLPYVVTGATERREPIYNFGLDAKTSLTDQLQFVGTLGPDFRNVESSILSLDFSYFERIGNETRPFFQEGSGFLRSGSLFRSQRIRQIDLGAKVYGRLSPTDTIGAQVVSDFGERTVAVAGFERSFGDNEFDASVVANMENGRQNLAGRMSWENRWGNWYPNFEVSFTDDEARGSGWAASAGYNYNKRQLNYGVGIEVVTPDYFPRAGFAPQTDQKGMFLYAGNNWENLRGSVERVGVNVSASRFDRFDGGFYRDNLEASVWGRLRNRMDFSFYSSWGQFEENNDRFRNISLGFPSGDPYRRITVGYGDNYVDGARFRSWSVGARYKPLNRLQLDGSLELVDFRGFDRQAVIGFRYDLDKAQSIGGRVVLRGDEWNGFATYRLGGRRGNEYFLIIGDPNSDKWRNRVAFKAVIPVTIRY